MSYKTNIRNKVENVITLPTWNSTNDIAEERRALGFSSKYAGLQSLSRRNWCIQFKAVLMWTQYRAFRLPCLPVHLQRISPSTNLNRIFVNLLKRGLLPPGCFVFKLQLLCLETISYKQYKGNQVDTFIEGMIVYPVFHLWICCNIF